MSHIIDIINVVAANNPNGDASATTAVSGVLTAVRNVVSPVLLIVLGFAGFRFVFNHKIMEAIMFFIMAIFVCVIWFDPAIIANIGDSLGKGTNIGGTTYQTGN